MHAAPLLRSDLRPVSMRGLRVAVRVGLSAVLTLCCVAARADFPDIVAQVKASVVAVGTYLPTRNPQFSFRGTGFVVGNGNLAVTNSHVVPEVLEINESNVIVVPGTGRVVVRKAIREISDPDHDLLVLRFEGPPIVALKIGDSNAAREGQDMAFTGFPLGSVLGLVPVTHRGIISALTPVGQPVSNSAQLDARLIHRLASATYSVFQLDAVSYPGNSGSPLYDVHSGEVLGILNMVFVKGAKENALTNPSAISYAIPAQFLKALLDKNVAPPAEH